MSWSLIKRLFLSRKGEDDVPTLWELNSAEGLPVLFLLLQVPSQGTTRTMLQTFPGHNAGKGAQVLVQRDGPCRVGDGVSSPRDFAGEAPVFLHHASRFNQAAEQEVLVTAPRGGCIVPKL